MIKLGSLEEVTDLRKVWAHEASDFTPWLADDENIARLADAIGLDITVEERESCVGDFNVDIFASETGTDRKIIIENQLEDTDHDHLGKLITYASGKSASIVIWVVKHAREEHRSAVEWLNAHTDESISFFLLEIKLYRIGDSNIAPKFEVIEKPNDWAKEIKKQDRSNPTQQDRYEYWDTFNDYAFNMPAFAKVFRKRKPSTDHWMNFSIGSSDCYLAASQIRKRKSVTVELYISQDKELFRSLYEHKNEIEQKLNNIKLKWMELPTKKASRILVEHSVDFDDRAAWPQQFDWLSNTMLDMYQAFKPYI